MSAPDRHETDAETEEALAELLDADVPLGTQTMYPGSRCPTSQAKK